jgi:hypothetical protein
MCQPSLTVEQTPLRSADAAADSEGAALGVDLTCADCYRLINETLNSSVV